MILILRFSLHHKFRKGTNWEKDRKLLLHRNIELVIYINPLNSVSNIQSIKYQEIPYFTTVNIQNKFKNSEYLDNNSNLTCYPILINKATLHNNALRLIITNNSDNKVCIPKAITIGTSELISNDSYRINELNSSARHNTTTEAKQTLYKRPTQLIPT